MAIMLRIIATVIGDGSQPTDILCLQQNTNAAPEYVDEDPRPTACKITTRSLWTGGSGAGGL